MKLRARQVTFRDKCVAALDERGNTLGVASTGFGKTVALSAITGHYVDKGAKAMVLQHRDELTDQNRTKYRLVNPNHSTGLFNADRKDWSKQTTFAMAQTLVRNLDAIPAFDILTIDEGHHAAADGYLRIIDKARKANPNLKLLLVTATPNRGDKRSLRGVVDNVADVVGLRELIEARLLVPPRCFVIDLANDALAGVAKRGGEFDQGQVEKILDTDINNDAVVARWGELAGDRQTVVFCATVQHAEHVCEAFQGAGIRSAVVSGETPDGERRAILAAFDRGEIQVLLNVAVLTEGWDCPPTSCVVLLRKESYLSTVIQMVGRGLRTVDPEIHPGVVKDDCIAEGSLVLTDKGLVPIENVSVDMRVWDGVDFVSHQGPICRGEQIVISYAGLTATPDHKVWTDDGWKTFGECAAQQIAIRVTGAGRWPVKESYRSVRPDQGSGAEEKAISAGGVHWLPGERLARPVFAEEGDRRVPPMRQSEKPRAALADQEVYRGQATMHEPFHNEMGSLRWAWDQVQLSLSNSHGRMDGRSHPDQESRPNRPDQQRRALRTRQHPHDLSKNQHQQYGGEATRCGCDAPFQAEASTNPICGQDDNQFALCGPDFSRDCGSVLQPAVYQTKRVWDLLNAGPRHRFTVEGLLVSNCIVIDFGASLLTHGSLMQVADIDGKGVKDCEQCDASVPSQCGQCPLCGFVFPKPETGEDEPALPGVEGGEDNQKAVLTNFVMSEIDLLNDSPFRYETLFDGLVSCVTAFDAWATVISYRGRWHAVGGGKEPGVKHLADSMDRLIAMAAADDWMRLYGDTDGAKKTKRWLSEPCTDKQREHLGLDPMAAMGVTKYNAACKMTWRFNERIIRKILEGSMRLAA